MVHNAYNPQDNSNLDIDLQNVITYLPVPSAENNSVAFFMDNTVMSFAYMTIYTLIGDGFEVIIPKDKPAEDLIKKYNRNININGDTIEDYVVDVWIDNLIYGCSLWRVAEGLTGWDEKPLDGPDLQRLPPETIEIIRERSNGWRLFLQHVPAGTSYKTKNQFLRGEPMGGYAMSNEISIMDHPKLVIYTSFFKKAPMDTVLAFVVLKFWILTFIRKFAEKMWAPYMFGFVGDPKSNYYPDTEEEMDEALEFMAKTLVKVKNFSAAAFAGDSRVQVENLNSNGGTFLEFMGAMDRQIMFGLFSSIAARDSNGVYKANEIADETTVSFMKGIRRKIESELKRFYITNMVTHLEEEDIKFVWPELRTSSVQNIATSIEKLATFGIFKDANERRRAAAQIFPFLLDESLSEEMLIKLDKEFVDLNKPSQPKDEANNSGETKGSKSSNTSQRK